MTGPDDQAWVEAVVVAHEARLLRFAATIVGKVVALDVVQDTFVELCTADRAAIEGHLSAWLFTVCRNRAISARRKSARLRPEEEADMDAMPGSEPARSLETKEEARTVVSAIAELGERDREVVSLRFAGDLSYKEIAEVTGLSVSHVGVILHQAIRTIRAEMARRAARRSA